MKTRLKALLNKKRLIRSLGAHDVFSALVAEQAGFETIFIGGFGASASLLGQPDLNLLTMNEMAGAVRRMARRLSVPLVADGDTGHGGAHNVAETVRAFEQAGAQGIILEDQVAPKRCGHFLGKDVVSVAEMAVRLKAALAARSNSDFVIIARTDARDVKGLNEAIRRANFYHQTGADVVFIESPASVSELEEIPRRVKAPLLVNMLTGGKTPTVSVDAVEKMGYRIAVYPIESLLVTATAIRKLAKAVLDEGSIAPLREDMAAFSDIKSILGLDGLLGRMK